VLKSDKLNRTTAIACVLGVSVVGLLCFALYYRGENVQLKCKLDATRLLTAQHMEGWTRTLRAYFSEAQIKTWFGELIKIQEEILVFYHLISYLFQLHLL